MWQAPEHHVLQAVGCCPCRQKNEAHCHSCCCTSTHASPGDQKPKQSWMQLHQHNPSKLWLLERPWDEMLWHPSAPQTGERDDRQCGMTTVLRGPLLVPVLTVPFLAVHFAPNRMRVIPAWLIHKANSPCIRCSAPLCNAGTKDESVQIVTRILRG